MLVFGFKNIHVKSSLGVILSLALSINSVSFAQEGEALDINGLRAQLETSRSQSNSPDAPLDNAKKNLDQEEEALMKKLQNVVPANTAKAAETVKANADFEEKDFAENIQPAKNAAQSEVKKEVQAEQKKIITNTEIVKAVQKEEMQPAAELSKAKINNKAVEVASGDNIKIPNSDKLSVELKKRVAELQTRLNDKSKELEETRNRLVIAETQVERLSGILEKINNQKLAGYMGSGSTAKAAVSAPAKQVNAPLVNQVSNTKSSEESLVGIVTTQKAFLRSGPSKDDSPIMSVSKGTRLVVETRNNDWYRVITPTGGRAWISTQMIGFGAGAEPGSDSALRIGGYEKTLR